MECEMCGDLAEYIWNDETPLCTEDAGALALREFLDYDVGMKKIEPEAEIT